MNVFLKPIFTAKNDLVHYTRYVFEFTSFEAEAQHISHYAKVTSQIKR